MQEISCKNAFLTSYMMQGEDAAFQEELEKAMALSYQSYKLEEEMRNFGARGELEPFWSFLLFIQNPLCVPSLHNTVHSCDITEDLWELRPIEYLGT